MPSGKAQSPVRAATPNLEVFAGSFAPNGASNPDSASNKGAGFSVVHNGVAGQWKVTVTGATFNNVVAVTATLQLNAAPVTSMELILLGAVGSDGSGNTTLILQYRENLAAADIAANANNRVHFCLLGEP